MHSGRRGLEKKRRGTNHEDANRKKKQCAKRILKVNHGTESTSLKNENENTQMGVRHSETI